MNREWTKQQLNSIYSTDGSVLVSAAAGSGKTAVLVERVINLITRKYNPIDVDRLLIVTFTRAAAAEMRQRITEALNSMLENDPYNSRLLMQKQLLYNASISTIDSFCGNIVREYFHAAGVSSDFRIADEGELEILRNQALDRSFETFYETESKEFSSLLDAFSSKGGDTKLRETVLKICTFLSTQPFPNKWLDDMLSSYGEHSVADSIWGKIIIDYSVPAVNHAVNLTENSIKLLDDDQKLKEKTIELFESDLVFLNELGKRLLSANWDDIVMHLSSFKSGRMSAPRGYKDNPLKLAVSSNRDEVKSTIKQISSYFCRSEAEACAEFSELESIVAVLFELVREYIKEFDLLKSKKNILSFADVELLTVKLLAKPDEKGGYIKTPQAYEISERYDAVIVDEFQDVNDVQNLIFNCASNDENNLFVVGDVKQSIYGFRQAKPQIFINRKESYQKFDERNPVYPATIILDKNFRSRKEVCDTVNFIFSRLMTKQVSGMDYTKDERLNTGAKYPESDSCDFEISLIEKSAFEDEDYVEIEARHIADKIHKMIGSGFTVKDVNVQRSVTYGDFAVILRSTKSKANKYVNVLAECGIPAYCEEKENFFDALEVKILLNILRIIDNPTLDIPLLSVLCSPLYGLTPDELSLIRSNDRYSNLYTSLVKFSKTDKKAKDFLKELSDLRAYSCISTVDELIGKIYETTALGAVTSAVRGGESPLQNLNLIRVYARNFEANGFKTLSDFVSFIDNLINNKTAVPASSSINPTTLNGVRVLSIHKSKGLEFPVCFIADAAHEFNKTDLKSDVLIDSYAGLGIKRRQGICRYNTLPRLAVEIEISKNEIAEELRILYVALTRAKEKLIMVASIKNIEKYLSNLYSKLVFESIIEPYTVERCKSICDWIMLTALVNPSLYELRKTADFSATPVTLSQPYPNWKFEIIDKRSDVLSTGTENSLDFVMNLAQQTEQVSDEFNYGDLLKKNLDFKYKNAEIMSLPQKVSASQIAHNQNEDYFDKVLTKPTFINRSSASSVKRGTAHHLFLQYCDFQLARDDINSEVERLMLRGRLTEEQSRCIDSVKLSELLHSELFDRIIRSEKIYREERFTVKIKASEAFEDYANISSDAYVIMQGAIDLAFVEDGKLVIVDYKTDRVGDIAKLVSLYKKQLELYKQAMEQSTEYKVKELIICSVHLNRYISL